MIDFTTTFTMKEIEKTATIKFWKIVLHGCFEFGRGLTTTTSITGKRHEKLVGVL